MSGLVRADGELTITPESAGWGFSGLRVLELGRASGARWRPAATS